MAITSLGIGSGLDANSIVSQLVALERRPIAQLQAASGKLQTQISAYGQLQAGLDALRTRAEALTKAGAFDGVLSSSSDASSVAVQAGTGAVAGSYTVEVQRLASAQSVASPIFASAKAPLGAGDLRIDLGSLKEPTPPPGGYVFTPGDNFIELQIKEEDSLEGLRDRINAAKKGVTASIVTDESGARLMLRSTETGLANGFRVSVSNAAAESPLRKLAFDPAAYDYYQPAPAGGASSTAPANARATLNGVPVGSSSNTLSNVVDGLTLTLGKVTSAPITVSTTQDKGGLKKAVQEFATAYNDLSKLLASQTRYDESGKSAGVLQGDSAARSVQSQLRSLVGGGAGASSVYARLSDIGLEVQRDGTLKANETRLDAAVANGGELKKLFASTEAGSDGLAVRLKSLAAGLNNGIVSSRKTGVQSRIDSNTKQQERLGLRVEQIEARLRAQYTALDKKMGQTTALSSYVTQQVNAFNRGRD